MKKSVVVLSGGTVVIAVVLLCRLMTLSMFPLIEPSEARYAAIGARMAFSRDFVVPWIWVDGCLVPFLGKPPLFFWMEAASVRAFGVNEFAARLPCFLCAALVIGTIVFLLRGVTERRVPVLAGVMTAASVLFLAMSGTVAVDMTLTLGVTLAFCAWFRWLKAESRGGMYGWSLLVFAGLAVAVLAKGLIGIVLFGAPVFLWHLLFGGWKRVFTRHALAGGGVLFAALVLPWFFLIQSAMQDYDSSFNFFHYFFVEEHVNRFLSKEYTDLYGTGRVQPRGMSVLFMFAAAFPWSVIPLWRVFRRGGRKMQWTAFRTRPDEMFFLLAWVFPVLFFAFARQILITYLLPAVPAFGIWLAMVRARRDGEDKDAVIYRTAIGITLSVTLLVAALHPLFPDLFAKMNTKRIIEQTLHETPDAEIVVSYKGRFYSPYFYAYHHLYNGAHPDVCLIKSNQDTFFPMPCAQQMPTRISGDRMRDLKTYANTVTGANVRVVIRTENFDAFLPEADPRGFSGIQFFRFVPAGDRLRLETCSPADADYERLRTEGIFSVLRPVPQTAAQQEK